MPIKTNLLKKIVILFFAVFAFDVNADSDNDWKKINQDNEIEVFSRKITDSSMEAFKGVGIIEASVEKVLWVLLDNEHRTEWVNRLKYSKIIEEKAKPYEYVVYQEFEFPWPMGKRDLIYKGKVYKDENLKEVKLKMKSVEHQDAPKTSNIRAELYGSRYKLKPLGKNKTILTVKIHYDPKGSVPKWLTNSIQKKWPIKTIDGIRKQVKKDFVRDLNLFE